MSLFSQGQYSIILRRKFCANIGSGSLIQFDPIVLSVKTHSQILSWIVLLNTFSRYCMCLLFKFMDQWVFLFQYRMKVHHNVIPFSVSKRLTAVVKLLLTTKPNTPSHILPTFTIAPNRQSYPIHKLIELIHIVYFWSGLLFSIYFNICIKMFISSL